MEDTPVTDPNVLVARLRDMLLRPPDEIPWTEVKRDLILWLLHPDSNSEIGFHYVMDVLKSLDQKAGIKPAEIPIVDLGSPFGDIAAFSKGLSDSLGPVSVSLQRFADTMSGFRMGSLIPPAEPVATSNDGEPEGTGPDGS